MEQDEDSTVELHNTTNRRYYRRNTFFHKEVTLLGAPVDSTCGNGMVYMEWKEQEVQGEGGEPKEIVTKECIRDIVVLIRHNSNKKTNQSSLEFIITNNWLATTMQNYDLHYVEFVT